EGQRLLLARVRRRRFETRSQSTLSPLCMVHRNVGGRRVTSALTSLDKIGQLLAQALLPLGEMAGEPETVERAIRSLGFAPPPGIDLGTIVALDPSAVVEKLQILLRSTEEEQNNSSIMSSRAADLIFAVAALTKDIATFAEGLPTALAAAGDYATRSDIANQLPRRLLDLLIV